MSRITLQVIGIPQPKGSKTAIVRGDRAVVIEGRTADARANFVSWRQAIERECRDYLKAHAMAALAEPVSVDVRFRFPAVSSDRYRTVHTTKPDLDKLERALYDALVSGGLLVDDCWIWNASVSKRYCVGEESPGAVVSVTPQGHMEGELRRHRVKKAAEERRKARVVSR